MIRIVTLLALLAAMPLGAATLTVTNLNDTGAGSLRQACTDAASGDTVVFQPGLAGTITFALLINLGTKALTITGNADVSGAPTITLDGNGATRLLNTGAALSLDTLVLSGGSSLGSQGGAIRSTGALTCTDCTFSGNQSGLGGAIYCDGSGVTCTGCTFSSNYGQGNGGAIHCGFGSVMGNVTCTACTFEYNFIDGGYGGAITSNGAVTCTDCTFFANSIDSGGGSGGAIYQSGLGNSVNCTNCTFYGNNTFYGGSGGAIYCQCDGIACTGCTFSNNYALGNGGAIHAGVYAVTCTDCTFSSNSGIGRCLYTSAQVTITNCIVAEPLTGTMFAGGGAFTSGGYNICTASAVDVPWMNATGDQMSTDPILGPVQDNGGPVPTMRPAINSPAIDQGGGSVTTVDARGYARPADDPAIANAAGGDGRDVGAVEFAFNSAPDITAPATLNVAQDTPHIFSGTLSISDNSLAGDELQLTLTATQGTLTLAQITGLTFTTGDGTADASMDLTGTLAEINAALNGAQFIPATGYLGAAGLQIDIDDQGNAGDGPVLTDSETVAITVLLQPEITLLRDGVEIIDGGGDNAYGAAGTALSRVFTIRNDGFAALNIGAITFSNQNNCTVTLSTAPATTLAPTATTTFTLNITPTAEGAFSFDMQIASDDADENPYNVHIVGTATKAGGSNDGDDDESGCTTGATSGYPVALAAALLLLAARRRRHSARA